VTVFQCFLTNIPKETIHTCQKHSIHSIHLNNLYGKAMTEPLPTGFFQWVDDVESFDVKNIPKHGDLGYVLDIDL